MSVNRYQSHVLFLPEDEADKALVNGFLNALDPIKTAGKHRILTIAGGWLKAEKQINPTFEKHMSGYPQSILVVVIDSDRDPNRPERIMNQLPAQYQDRVFVVSSLIDPESLKQGLGCTQIEEAGQKLADACAHNEQFDHSPWAHDQLRHNKSTIERMAALLRPILFPS
jgi:hypothetical protein